MQKTFDARQYQFRTKFVFSCHFVGKDKDQGKDQVKTIVLPEV